MNNKPVKIYTSPTCPHCRRLKNFLKEQEIKFTNLDVTSDEKLRREMMEKSGQLGVPVIDIDGEIIIGFNKSKLKNFLN